MQMCNIPSGLIPWNDKIKQILDKPFPPMEEFTREEKPQFDKISTWALLCEEVLDTVPPKGLLKQYYDELILRGYKNSEIQEMRHFVWLTLGWLNYEKMVWEWCILDKADIRKAILLQYEEKLISKNEMENFINYLGDKD